MTGIYRKTLKTVFAVVCLTAQRMAASESAASTLADPDVNVTAPSAPNLEAATNTAADPPPGMPLKPGVQGGQVQEQDWNWHIQNTYVWQGYPGFSAKYSGPNSLPSGGEGRETISLDLLAGVRLWRGAEAHIDGLGWQGFGVNNTLGVEGFPSGEAFRYGTQVPNGTFARLFIRQTIGLGGAQETVPDQALALAGQRDISRVTITIGRFSAKDIFDNNTYAGDARTQFMNWGLVANEAWDYPADAIGFDTGLALELNQPDWTVRYGFFQVPRVQNSLTADDWLLKWPYDGSSQDGPLLKAWAMVTELERRWTIGDHPGVVRFLAFLNSANMADYSAATAILVANGPGADFTAARSFHYKYGFGLNWEQEIVKNIGVFSRLGWNDDREEGWMFSDVGHAGSLGLSFNGAAWNRPDDTIGLAGVVSGISKVAQEFFAAGGTGILASDGGLNYGPEEVIETYYDAKIWKSLHGALDYQFVNNPAFNRDRGPVSIFAGRLHWEF
jgi:high affinity Mn2+ porin